MDDSICLEEVGKLLKKRVSALNAQILLDAAVAQSGLKIDIQTSLNKEQVDSLCLSLINKGGPSFQVGKEVYSKYTQ